MLDTLDTYLEKGICTQQVVDIAVLAAAKCLSINMCIYKNNNGVAILYNQPSKHQSMRDIYLKFDKEHYDAIVMKSELWGKMDDRECITTDFDIQHQVCKGTFNKNISHLLKLDEQKYFNQLGYEFVLADTSQSIPSLINPTIQDIGTEVDKNNTYNKVPESKCLQSVRIVKFQGTNLSQFLKSTNSSKIILVKKMLLWIIPVLKIMNQNCHPQVQYKNLVYP